MKTNYRETKEDKRREKIERLGEVKRDKKAHKGREKKERRGKRHRTRNIRE